jgi:hypothetical protein
MITMVMPMRIARLYLVVGALACVACHTMRSETLEDLIAEPAPRVWVTRPDQSVVVIDGPQVFRGKLVGFVEGRYRELQPADVRRLVVRRLAPGRTLALVGAGAAGVLVAVAVLSGRGEDFDACVGGAVDCRELTP